MDKRLTPEQENAMIEDALNNIPLAPMRRSVTVNVMARIKQTPAPRPFQMTWPDFAIAFVISLCIGAILFSLRNFPPLAFAHIRIQGILFYQDLIVNARWLIPSALFGLAALMFALTAPYFYRQLMK